ncbi:thioredoxin-like protein [Auriculariales sp. MPI-PUGE-AT-0066]|nr:thioredoxin-like protein [Auriculariales sp. MPI-PUGE-AT-0066]
MAEMKREFERVRGMRDLDHGHYTEITDEKQVIETTAKESACIVHFYHRDFDRCKIMDRHLEALAPRYFATRFIRVFVENVPWLVNKLQVQVLPFIGCFMDGVLKHRMVGFEELGNDDSFATAALEMRLSLIGVIQAAGPTVSKKRGKGRRKGSDSGDDGSDDD